MSEALRLLYVLPYVPSPIRVRPYQLIRHLARRGHKITVVALEDAFTTPDALAELNAVCAAVHVVPHGRVGAALRSVAAVPTRTPLWAAYCQSPRMGRLLRQLAGSGQFDVAHVEHLRAAHFVRDLAGLPCVLDAVDCITELRHQMLRQKGGKPVSRLLSWEEWAKLRGYEPRSYRPFGRIAVTSEHDARSLIALDPQRLPPVEVIPNGVDLEYFAPQTEKKLTKTSTSDSEIYHPTLVFSGKMSYSANDDAARYLLSSVFPRLVTLVPGVRLVIAGSSPSPALVALAGRAGERVTVTGYVDDLRPYLSGAIAAVCPMRIGVGIQNKVLEAMAMARPVVCSPLAARAFVGSFDGGGAGAATMPIRVAGSAEEFAAECAALVQNRETAKIAGCAARQYVEQFHDWQKAADRFTVLYHEVALRGAGTTRRE